MKKLLLLILTLFAVQSAIFAQTCTPDETLPDSIIIAPLPYTEMSPESGIQDTACVNGYFETYFYFNIPSSVEIGGTALGITSVTVNDVPGLPESFNYACLPADCDFPADSSGCIVIYGTATESEIGEHDVKVDVTFIAGGFPITRILPDGLIVTGNYYLNVKPEGSDNCTIISSLEERNVFDLPTIAYPNPTDGITSFMSEVKDAGNLSFEIRDLSGKLLYSESKWVSAGNATLDYNTEALESGLYIYTLSIQGARHSGKLMVY